VLGEGQFGIVRRVAVQGMETRFALKKMSKRKVIDLDQQGPCKLECEILRECCFPLIVQLISTFQDESNVYILMELLGGDDLFTAIRNIGRLNEEQILFFSASIVLSIEYIHSRGVIYRDLKPENIMLTENGFVRLVDFGCCSRKSRTYTFIGTPEYIAPEVILGKGYGKPVDWWGIGVIVYEMACGPLPFGEGCDDPLAVFREILEKPLDIPGTVCTETADFVQCLLERGPEQRLGSSLSWRNEVREHPFFAGLQWDAVLDETIVPPFRPDGKGEDSDDSDDDEKGEDADKNEMSSKNDAPPDLDADLSCFIIFTQT
jgi:cGMP-dependent protein kinase